MIDRRKGNKSDPPAHRLDVTLSIFWYVIRLNFSIFNFLRIQDEIFLIRINFRLLRRIRKKSKYYTFIYNIKSLERQYTCNIAKSIVWGKSRNRVNGCAMLGCKSLRDRRRIGRKKKKGVIFPTETAMRSLFVPLNSVACRAAPRHSGVVRVKKPLRQMFDCSRDAPEELVVLYSRYSRMRFETLRKGLVETLGG